MGDTPSRKPLFRDMLKRFFLTGKILTGIIWAAIFIVALFIINQSILPKTGYKLRIDSGRLKFGGFKYYSKNESKVLGVLVEDTPVLGRIPQQQYIQSRTKLNKTDIAECIGSLEKKGDLALDESGGIISAYPWTDSRDFAVYLIVNQDSAIGPLGAAGAFYAMSVAPLLGFDIRVKAKLKDTGEPLVIEIGNDEIIYVSRITAVAYRTEDYKNGAFYSSPDAVAADYAGHYDINRVIRLDRALLIGDIIAREIKDKIER